jgi:hypothetical protein
MTTLSVLTDNIDTLRASDNERRELVKRLAAGESVSSLAISAGHRPSCEYFRNSVREAVNGIYFLVMLAHYFRPTANEYEKTLIGRVIVNWSEVGVSRLMLSYDRYHIYAVRKWLVENSGLSEEEFAKEMEKERAKLLVFRKSLKR